MSGAAVRVAAQAKLNLFLHVLAREQSGYHQLETLFCRLELADDVVIRLTPRERSVDVRSATVPLDALGAERDNLALRAATAFCDATAWATGFAIEIEKRIPIGGGLGGGSADAGAALRGMNALAPTPLSGRSLLRLAATLGADVPFLTAEMPLALAWGRGERLLPLPTLPAAPVVLLIPDFGIATRDAFSWLDAGRGAAAPSPAELSAQLVSTWPGVASVAGNDFAPVVFARYPALAAAEGRLWERGATLAGMTGSGATLFGIFTAPPDAIAHDETWRAIRTATATRVVGVERVD